LVQPRATIEASLSRLIFASQQVRENNNMKANYEGWLDSGLTRRK
jgi:hypothetical protein